MPSPSMGLNFPLNTGAQLKSAEPTQKVLVKGMWEAQRCPRSGLPFPPAWLNTGSLLRSGAVSFLLPAVILNTPTLVTAFQHQFSEKIKGMRAPGVVLPCCCQGGCGLPFAAASSLFLMAARGSTCCFV